MNKYCKVMPVFALALAVCGCAASWTKPGASDAQREADLSACQSQAKAEYPVKDQKQVVQASEYVDSHQNCFTKVDGGTECDTIPAYYAPEKTAIVDVNEDSRAAALESCMMGKGWSKPAG